MSKEPAAGEGRRLGGWEREGGPERKNPSREYHRSSPGRPSSTICSHGDGLQDGKTQRRLGHASVAGVASVVSKQPWLTTFCVLCSVRAWLQATEGMNVKEECQRWFMEMKWKKVHRFVVYKIDERSRAVLVDKVGGPGEGYEELVAALPGDDCRYAVFDFDFVTVDNCQKSKIFFIAWSPTASRIRAKILYATSKQGLRRLLDGVHYEVQATDPSEMGFDVIRGRAQ
ncbi:Actin-depolymerizing factor 5 [Dichanthelium oligosanthes]|uniref:Actin-depolymerizing factor 5 n=1 Tax=Dichanthelium oligosanthes TaxID=888268 RepID=A0A1E5WB17_9POAL|nr:Actin-depolymerizing factor 5 [Dichanthelium oligosanthes]